MDKAIEIVEMRIEELESIIASTPISRSFTAQARKVEAEFILSALIAASMENRDG